MPRTRRIQRAVLAAVAVALALPAGANAQVAPPASDTAAGAPFLPLNTAFVFQIGGFGAAGEPYNGSSTKRCDVTGAPMDKTIWFKVVGTGGSIILSTARFSTTDTLVSFYAANAQPSDGTAVFCNDDNRGPNLAGELQFPSAAGAVYYTQWGCTGTACTGTLSVEAITNDQRAFAVDANSATYGNVGSTAEAGEVLSCGGVPYNRTVWFRWQAPGTGRVTFDVSRFDTVTALYAVNGSSPITCNDDFNGNQLDSRVSADVTPGQVYLLQVGGQGASLGTANEDNFILTTTFEGNQDLDGDTFESPGPDCNDANAAIHPGAAETPNNNVDENCDGVIAYDRDGDLVLDPPAGNDCDPTNKAVHPGAAEVAGNSLDEDCANGPAVRRLTTPRAEFRGGAHLIGSRFVGYFASGIDVTRLTKGATVSVHCRGRGRACKSFTAKATGAKMKLWFRKSHAELRLGLHNVYDVKIYIPKRPFVAGAYVRLVPSSRGQKDCSGRLRQGTLRISGHSCHPAL